ncbi:M61 family metallopeptidase [Hymenobacter oligotrophus]|uniref:M61 family metallopeptidase n=1 Tax=Hymenobacter oligotrophus TaxID=2319843 RepID=UPI0021D0FEDD|nr:hypothetical protein [Hymenobacter oligotrophus]
MCGSSLEADHALLNGQTVFGYPQGMQGNPLRIKLNYPADWKVGTALVPDAQGYYRTKSYDHAVDSPILLGPPYAGQHQARRRGSGVVHVLQNRRGAGRAAAGLHAKNAERGAGLFGGAAR